MPRLGINISKDLMDRLKPYKHRMNVSQMCREAIEERVSVLEKVTARVEEDNMEDTVMRLVGQFENQNEKIDWEQMGLEDAKVWIELADIEKFELLKYRLKFKPPLTTVIVPPIDGVQLFNERSHEHNNWFETRYEYDEQGDFQAKAGKLYNRGWFAYFQTVAEKVQEELGRRGKLRLDSEIATHRETLERADVPERLVE